MRVVLLIAAMMLSPMAYGEDHMIEGDNYIESDNGQIVLFALPGCEMGGKAGLFGHAIWKTGVSEIICWQYDKVIYIYAPKERTIIFDPSDVKTRGADEVHAPLYGSRCPAQTVEARNRWPSMPCRVLQDSMVSLYQPDRLRA